MRTRSARADPHPYPGKFTVMPVSQAQVIDALRPVEDPELHRSIVDLGMVKNVGITDGEVQILVALTVPGCPLRAEIDRRVTEAVRALDGVRSVGLEFTVMSEDELRALRERLHGDPASRTRVLLIASGKGGVGKSSVTTNLAVAMARRGRSVAVVDADVWG